MGSGRDKRRKAKRSQRHHTPNWEAWSEKTDAQLLTEKAFIARKHHEGWHVLGVMGFAGSWKRSGLAGEQLTAYVEGMASALRTYLTLQQERWGASLVVSSGATYAGTLQLTYDICTEQGIRAMGVTPDRTLRYPIGRLDLLLPVGRRYGDESEVFLNTADAFVLVGGGDQSRRETEEAHRRGKPVSIIQGFGGVADIFSAKQLPQAIFFNPNTLSPEDSVTPETIEDHD
ncbi:MAG: hypothetical protein AAFX99_15220 [Myxococcota bacterium]